MSARDVSCGPSLNCPVTASVCNYRYCPSLSVFLVFSGVGIASLTYVVGDVPKVVRTS